MSHTCTCEPRTNATDRIDGHSWVRPQGRGPSTQIGVRVIVTPDQTIRVVQVGRRDDFGIAVGTILDADTVVIGPNRWVQSCDEFYAWHIDGTTAWGMCRQGDHSCCQYSLERVLASAPFHYGAARPQ